MNYIIILAILLLISLAFVNNYYPKIVFSYLLLVIIIYLVKKNIYQSLFYSLIILIILNFFIDERYEYFDTTKLDDKSVNIPDDNADEKTDEKIDDDDERDDFDEKDLDMFTDNVPKGKTKDKYTNMAKAQRETFHLINTIKQLDDTVKNLAPTLKQGADIIEKFKKLGLAK